VCTSREEGKSHPQSNFSKNIHLVTLWLSFSWCKLCFLLQQILWILETESISSNAKEFCGIIFALSKDMLQCSETIWIGHSCFSVNKYACSQSSESFDWSQLVFCDKKYAFSCSSAIGRGEHIVLCHSYVPQNQSKCFQMFLRRVGSPVPKLKSPKFGGVYLYSPAPGNILCADTRAHMFLGGGGIGLKAFYSPVFQ
jgi:hypothetical protein